MKATIHYLLTCCLLALATVSFANTAARQDSLQQNFNTVELFAPADIQHVATIATATGFAFHPTLLNADAPNDSGAGFQNNNSTAFHIGYMMDAGFMKVNGMEMFFDDQGSGDMQTTGNMNNGNIQVWKSPGDYQDQGGSATVHMTGYDDSVANAAFLLWCATQCNQSTRAMNDESSGAMANCMNTTTALKDSGGFLSWCTSATTSSTGMYDFDHDDGAMSSANCNSTGFSDGDHDSGYYLMAATQTNCGSKASCNPAC